MQTAIQHHKRIHIANKRFNNQLHSLRLLPVPSKDRIKSLEKMIVCMKKEIKLLEQKLGVLLKHWQPQQLKNVSSINGVGKRAAAMLLYGYSFTVLRKNSK